MLTDEDESADYAFDELHELTRAYAATIHSRRALAAAIRTPAQAAATPASPTACRTLPAYRPPGQAHEQPAQAAGKGGRIVGGR